MSETVKKHSGKDGSGWLPPQREERELTPEEQHAELIRQIKRQEKLSMIEYVRRHTPALAQTTFSIYKFSGE